MSPLFRTAFAVAIAVGIAALPGLARADGRPVVSLEPMYLGRLPVMIYSDRASPVTSLPVRRVTGSGQNVEIEYDTSATPRPVVSCVNPRIVGTGENASSECNEAATAAAPHTMPDMGGGHNAALWNLQRLSNSVR
ncbi:hypothetical protein [Falsiroseomonas tokyonensis]|uniref:Uncharacterized protein n=1 Tax=Falsiroseomonas tokyonensis TaxID=430521 RepID=A0ABV7C2P5_9PROT|nr:hypothetical protein [Falsiroseomonas tokyonensis]MBU8541711.1 hypothetical protein [Falsiroseomonas tokyonensis]